MTVLIPYLIKLSISLVVVYLFYRLFLRRLTFYNWNRWYLLIYSAASFFIPFINIYPVLEKNNWDNSGMVELIPVVSYQLSSSSIVTEAEVAVPWTFQDWSILLMASGAAIMLLRLIIQQISFIRIRRSSTLLLNEKIKVYQVNKKIIPFSYGNSIFVNQHLHSEEELKEIIRHEFIHVKQKHTMDIIWGEFLCILNWYNPFAWLIRRSIRQNLEFIADNKVLENGIDRKEYQYLLLKVIGVSHFSVATQFNFSSLKKRIAMMNKIKSAKVHLLKFLFMLPLMAVLLLAFRNNIVKNATEEQQVLRDLSSEHNSDIVAASADINAIAANDTIPKKWKLPANVSNISITDGIATVKLKNGTIETYNLNDDDELSKFEKKYGKVPPPPPHPPVPTKPGKAPLPPPAYYDTPDHIRSEPTENSKGYIVSIADNNGESVVIIKDKNNKIVKAMALTEWNDHESENRAKYGEMPPVSPAKPVAPASPAAPAPSKKDYKPRPVTTKPAAPAIPAPGIDNGIITAPSQESFYAEPVKPSTRPVKPAVRIRGIGSINDDIIYIIDGVKQPAGEHTLNTLDPDNIESIQIIKEGTAKALYGGQAVAGVIIITTKKAEAKKSANLDKLDGYEGLIIVDGDEMKKEELNEKIKPENIESINILRSEEATKIYGDKGKKGVMIIRTKAKTDPVIVSGVNTKPSKSDPGKFAIFKSDKATIYGSEPFHGIYIIDGKEYSEQEFKALQFDPNAAKTVNAYAKGQGSVNRFGEKGRNGVIVISTEETRPARTGTVKSAGMINRIVAGIIIDQQTRKPIAGVKVYCSELDFETSTDKNGYYFVQLKKAATVLPRIYMTHPQYFSAMMFDGSYGKETEKDNTLVLFMGMHKGDPKNITQHTTSSMAQQYTLTSNKTPGYEHVNEILKEWLKRYDIQRDQAKNDQYIDRVKVHDGMMNWTLIKDSKKHPLFLFEKRVIGKDPKAVEKLVNVSDIYEFEIIAHGELLKSYGDQAKDGIVNLISKANKENQNVRLVAKKKITDEELASMLAEAAKLNVLYVGIENPLKIQVENIPANEIEVKFESGTIHQRNGVFYAIPSGNTGSNSKVDIYKKNANGQLQLLNSRYFRVRSLPEQNSFVVNR